MRFSTIPALARRSHASLQAGYQLFMHVRRQMAAGQGGFHVGALSRGSCAPGAMGCFTGADFLYVYDCGSDPKRHVHREINTLLAARPERHLDLLVLSHFDRDHICGTPELLRKRDGFSVDTIMLPFVEMDERIVSLAQAAAEQEDSGGYIDHFFIDMVFEPVETLARFGPRRIILVRGDSDDTPMDGGGSPDFDPHAPEVRVKRRDHRPIDGEDPIKMALVDAYNDPQRPAGYQYRATSGTAQVFEVRNLALALSNTDLSVEWKLLPWVRRAAPTDVAAFRAKVEVLFGWPSGSFATQVLKPAIRHQMAVTKRTKMARAYREAFSDKNLTSLCLYSGPRYPDRMLATAAAPRLPNHSLTKIGWLGTGDAHLKDPTDIAAFKHGYAKDLAYVSTYLFPHHGSIKNSDPGDLIVEADMWVAAADPIHDWEHPHWQLQGAVATMGKIFRHVRASVPTAAQEVFFVIGKP